MGEFEVETDAWPRGRTRDASLEGGPRILEAANDERPARKDEALAIKRLEAAERSG